MPFYPRFTYGGTPTNLDFTVYPFDVEYTPEVLLAEANAPGMALSSTTEFVPYYILTNNFIYIPVSNIVEGSIDGFWFWWAYASKGNSFTFYPDKDTPGTSYTVIEAMKGQFAPKKKDGLYSIEFILQDITP